MTLWDYYAIALRCVGVAVLMFLVVPIWLFFCAKMVAFGTLVGRMRFHQYYKVEDLTDGSRRTAGGPPQ